MVLDVIEPWIVLGSDVIEPMIVGSDVIEPLCFQRADQTCHTPGRWNHHFIWCLSTVHFSANRSCNKHHTKKIGTGPGTPFKNQHQGRAYIQPTGVLPEDNLFPVPGQLLWADQWSSHGVTHQPHSGQPLHGGLWGKSHPNCQEPSKMWKRYVDDTCVILSSTSKDEFFHHINSIDPRIQFTSEDSKPDGSIPFLDSLVMPQPDGSIKTTVFKKPTHTDMYLHWDSYHHLSAKYSVINTLRHRAKTVWSTKQLLTEEEDHLYNALSRCKYPLWAWNRTNIKKKQKKSNQGNNNTKKSYIVVPYMKGLGETCKNICRRYGVEVYFRGGSTIRDLLVHPKDRDTILKKSGVIYRYRCGRVDCEEEYIGESGRTFGERYREHMRAPSPIMDHKNTTGHEVILDNFSIVGREDNSIARNIKEAIFIRVNDPSLNRNIGKFQLSHIWDEVLARSPELHLK